MLRVYLDHWVWVELAKAAKGDACSAAFRDLLDMARFGVNTRLLSFPLSLVHYMELHHTSSARRRYEVGNLMYDLSQGHRMIGPTRSVAVAEFDRALSNRFGVPQNPRTVQVFGIGTGHLFDKEPLRLRLVPRPGREPAQMDPGRKARIEARANDLMERALLCGPPKGVEVRGYNPNAHRLFAEDFVFAERDQADKFQKFGADSRYQRRVLLAREWILLRDAARDSLTRAGISSEWFFSQGADFLTEFISDLPVVNASLEMRRFQHQNAKRTWTPNDQYDVSGLSMAVVHCNVIVAEKHWAHIICQRARLDALNSTLVFDKRQLPDLLSYLARAA